MSEITDQSGTRILRPFEYEKLITSIPKLENKTKFKMLLFSGMRYAEGVHLYKHPQLFTGDGIKMPSSKTKATQKERWIILTPEARTTVEYYLHGDGLPHIVNWDSDLKRWADLAGIGSKGMSSKTTRKTWESWLVCSDKNSLKVCVSQGHTQITALQYYITLPFTDEDKVSIARYTKDWK